jgi:hypothetical protein
MVVKVISRFSDWQYLARYIYHFICKSNQRSIDDDREGDLVAMSHHVKVKGSTASSRLLPAVAALVVAMAMFLSSCNAAGSIYIAYCCM